MKVKEFFKSNAFKSLVVLLVIVMISGALLAIFNDLLYVSPEEKFNRVIKKIYGGNATVEKTLEISDEDKTYSDGNVSAAYLMDDGNYLVQSTGMSAFGGGTVTVYVVVEMEGGKLAGIGKVAFDSTTVSKYYETNDKFFKTLNENDDRVVAGEYFGVSSGIVNPSSGATASARAINNAVNTAIDFVKKAVLGESVGETKYEHKNWVNSGYEITPEKETRTVNYKLSMKSVGSAPDIDVHITVQNGVITEYTIDGDFVQSYNPAKVDTKLVDGSYFKTHTLSELEALLGENGESSKTLLEGAELSTGATNSSATLIRAAVFALSNYETVLSETEGGKA